MGREVCYFSAPAFGSMNKVVLLTGATGFVGSQILKVLLESNVLVRCIVREGSVSKFSTQSDSLESLVFTKDLFNENEEWWEKSLQNVDTVIHAAWYAEHGKYLQSPKNIDCLQGTLRLAKGAARAGVRRMVGIGTCAEYQTSSQKLTTETPLNPLSPYAAAKAAAFLCLSQWLPPQGIEFAWCRLFYLHGEGEDPRRLIPFLRERLASGKPVELTSGNQIRDFLDVKTVAHQIVQAALGSTTGALNIASGIPASVRKIAESIADEYGRRDLLLFGARADNPFDPPYLVGVPSLLN